MPAALDAMGRAIAHRGPDDTGVLLANSADGAWQMGLLHRRPSIIDIATGHQPLGNEDGDVQIIFNGEIYNFQPLRDELIALGHHFRTASDTETIVHAYVQWGEECASTSAACLLLPSGMRAMSVCSWRATPSARNPCFWWQHEGKLAFGSEIKALLALPDAAPQADQAAIWDYFAYRLRAGPGYFIPGHPQAGARFHCDVGKRQAARARVLHAARQPAPRSSSRCRQTPLPPSSTSSMNRCASA